MAASVRIELNRKGVSELLKSDEVRYDLQKRASAIAAAANSPEVAEFNRDGYEARSFVGHDRAQAVVRTATRKAKESEAENHTLLRALQAGAF